MASGENDPRAVTSAPLPAPPHPSVDAGEWTALIASRSESGEVTPNDVAQVLRGVELSEEMLDSVTKLLKQVGITISSVEPDEGEPVDRRPAAKVGPAAGDAVKMYLHEIGQVKLLTAEDERRLGKAIRDGQHAKQQMDSATSLGAREKREFRGVIRDGEEALEHLIKANLRLVVSIARRYEGRELQFADLIQEGNIGLMRAAEKYDWEKGFKFSTYATWWIRQAMMRAMADQGRTIRIPSHVVELINRVAKAQRELTVELEREPSFEEISERTLLEPERVGELLQLSSAIVSLDQPLSSEEDSGTISDRVPDIAEAPVELAERNQLIAAISAELQQLPDRDRRILEKRFGIPDGQPRTLDDVAKEEGVTRERIRQIEQKTLARMRHPNNSRRLRAFLDEE
jgi:RNA polymerase primary sigma factor